MASSKDLAFAFGLVLAAGASTTLGAASVFVCRPGWDLRIALACSLGLSAGVMIYISFVEIFAVKSIDGFRAAGYTNAESSRFSTLCFFGGMGMLWILDKTVHCILHVVEHTKETVFKKGQSPDLEQGTISRDAGVPVSAEASLETPLEEQHMPSTVMLTTHRSSTHQAEEDMTEPQHEAVDPQLPSNNNHNLHQRSGAGSSNRVRSPMAAITPPEQTFDPHEAVAMILRSDQKDVGLSRTGLLAAFAIGLHNLPEGLATFVAALTDPTAGAVLAVAIALHNIPEGIVVAMPVYLASGSKWKGFLWGCLSGITEPIGALLGYAALRGDDIPPLASGIMLGLVAGMMVWISITELLPTAFKYDPKHTYTITCTVTGMVIMAISLLLFEV